MVKASLSSNQWFGGLNRRFDRRARLLRRLGYRYATTPLGAVFVRGSVSRLESIAACVVMGSDNRAFLEAVRSPLRARFDDFDGLADRLQARVARAAG